MINTNIMEFILDTGK